LGCGIRRIAAVGVCCSIPAMMRREGEIAALIERIDSHGIDLGSLAVGGSSRNSPWAAAEPEPRQGCVVRVGSGAAKPAPVLREEDMKKFC